MQDQMNISYETEEALSPGEFIDILKRSTLSERRPVQDEKRIKKMCTHANLIITARLNGKLIGIARSLSDFSFCTYLSDLAVDKQYQRQSIGKKLVELTKAAAPDAILILLSAPAAVKYYPKTGMRHFDQCYIL